MGKRHENHLPKLGFDYVSVTGLLEECGWPTLASRRKDSRCILMHKILTGQVRVSQHHVPVPVQSRTRAGVQNKLPSVLSKTDLHQESFIARTSRDWNRLPLAARLATTVEEFKAARKA